MSPGSSTESYPAFARIGLRENLGKSLNQGQGDVNWIDPDQDYCKLLAEVLVAEVSTSCTASGSVLGNRQQQRQHSNITTTSTTQSSDQYHGRRAAVELVSLGSVVGIALTFCARGCGFNPGTGRWHLSVLKCDMFKCDRLMSVDLLACKRTPAGQNCGTPATLRASKLLKDIPPEPRRLAVARFRLNTEHDILGKHLNRLGILPSASCILCHQQEDMDRQHLAKCPALKSSKEVLTNSHPGRPTMRDLDAKYTKTGVYEAERLSESQFERTGTSQIAELDFTALLPTAFTCFVIEQQMTASRHPNGKHQPTPPRPVP
ncbi:hypothetical protein ANN_07309 [Periplaneta americana]|uniref:Uncharacterized protein n=1 Tax=Periplaneta americana TaxID=6978 RepID=A0ABQ8SZV4_PERAM|nr:hypothetical protein ANN_07309 [Periplaneta americana]